MMTFKEFLDPDHASTTFGDIFEREARAVEKASAAASPPVTVEPSEHRLTMANAFAHEKKAKPAQVAVPPIRIRTGITFKDVFAKAGIRT